MVKMISRYCLIKLLVKIRKLENDKCLRDVGIFEFLCIVGGNVDWCDYFGKWVGIYV